MGEITTVGIDLAKRVVSLHAEDAAGHVVLRKHVAPRSGARLVR